MIIPNFNNNIPLSYSRVFFWVFLIVETRVNQITIFVRFDLVINWKKDMNADKIQQICNLNKLFPLIFHTDCSVSSVWQLEKQTET